MAVRFNEFGFFDGVTKINQENWPKYMSAAQPDGIVITPWVKAKYGGELQVTASSTGMNITVAPGFVYIHSHFGILKAAVQLPIAPSHALLPRIDLAVVRARYQPSPGSVIELDVFQGVPAASPQAPTVTQTDGAIWELPLARISVSAGAVTIGQGQISDARIISVLPIEQGGTGAASPAGALQNIFQSNVLGVTNGGTGANNAEAARNNLGITGIINSIIARFHAVTGHNHDGTNSPKIHYNNIEGRPANLASIPGWWIELIPPANVNHGGHIDFHFNGNPADYTSRIIEVGNGVLYIQGVLRSDRHEADVGLAAFRQIWAGTSALIPGVSALASGAIYLQYE